MSPATCCFPFVLRMREKPETGGWRSAVEMKLMGSRKLDDDTTPYPSSPVDLLAERGFDRSNCPMVVRYGSGSGSLQRWMHKRPGVTPLHTSMRAQLLPPRTQHSLAGIPDCPFYRLRTDR
jgi:hypothetical protein